MEFSTPLHRATAFRREKRFFIYGQLADGTEVTAHCPNTGSMKGSLDTAVAVWLTHAPSPTRTLAYTLELAEQPDGSFTGLHTGRTNALVAEALKNGVITELAGAVEIKAEAKYSPETRFDFKLTYPTHTTWLEVKNVTMKATAGKNAGYAVFPDAVSSRGTKHLNTLAEIAAQPGQKAVQLYVVNRPDCTAFACADDIDPTYAAALKAAKAAGVEVLAYACEVGVHRIQLAKPLPLVV